MKKPCTVFVLFLVVTSISYSQSIKIGPQVWNTKNINVSKFSNGEPIPEAKTKEEWNRAGENKEPAWCYYDYNPANGTRYGKLYNWYAVSDHRGLAPKGWHVPSEAEWTTLIDYIEGKSESAISLKAIKGWEYHEGKSGNGNNSSGFNTLAGGYSSFHSESFDQIGYCGAWWTSTSTDFGAVFCLMSFRTSTVDKSEWDKTGGFSLRCVKD
jgi:uncharacterized protein (TIGR02145 family)